MNSDESTRSQNQPPANPGNAAGETAPVIGVAEGTSANAAAGPISTFGEWEPSLMRRIFFNSAELRAGWRLLIFLAMVVGAFAALMVIGNHFRPKTQPSAVTELTPHFLLIFDSIGFAVVLLASFVMSRIEKRRLGSYGLPLDRGECRHFGFGLLWGFGAISVLLCVLWMAHGYQVGYVGLHGRQLLYYPLAWGAAFILVGLSEEFMFRGYAQFALTTGIGFWPAAIVFSLLFGAVHSTNSGEQFMGLAQVVIVALFFCFTLWRTGTLWFAVGYHAAWDWGQTFFYGTADSGLLGRGHLLNPTFHGPNWLTGGTVGPEGSYLNIPLVLTVTLLFYLTHRSASLIPIPRR